MAIDPIRMETGKRTEPIFTVDKVLEMVLSIVYAGVWVMLLVWFWKSGKNDISAYEVTALKLILPIATVVVATLIGLSPKWGYFRWLMVLFFAFMYFLSSYLTLDLFDILKTHAIVVPDWHRLIPGAVWAAVGMAVGTVGRYLIRYFLKKEKEND